MKAPPQTVLALSGAVALVAVFGLAAIGAKACKNDHPYVPYAVSDAPSSALAEDAAVADVGDSGTTFIEQPSVAAPPDTTSWPLDGLTLQAPTGSVFVLALVRDLDGDGARDAVAVVRQSAPPEAAEILYFHGRPAGGVDPPVPAAAPPQIPVEAPCTRVARLGQIGAHSIVAEIGAACVGQEPPLPSRFVAAVSFAGAPRTHFSASIADPATAPKLSFEADGADLDHDGVDDFSLRVIVEGGAPPFEPGPKMSAVLKWLDRPAGMSREGEEPEASFRSLANGLLARAGHAKDAPSVPPAVAQLRELFAAICAEGGGPRITAVLGSPSIACGPSHALEDAGLAETRAFASLQDPLRAIGAFDRAQKAPATRTPKRTDEAIGWIAQVAPTVTATSMRAIGAVPAVDHGKAPSWGSLAFEASGKLLLRTTAGVVRVDPALGDESEAEGVAAWRTPVVSPDGSSRWIEAYNPCNGPALHATFAPTGDGEPHDVALPVAWPLGVRCTAAKGEPVPATPIAWSSRGLEAIVGGEPILIAPDLSRASPLAGSLDQPVTLGAPRSPNGRVTVFPTSQGLLVRAAKPRLYRAKEIDGGYLELRDCAVSDDATRVGCVRGGRAFVGIWDAPP